MSRSYITSLSLLGLWFLLLLAHSWHGPDIWYHLTWGRELVEHGHWIPQTSVLLTQPIPANGYWLFQSLMFGAFQLGSIYLVSAIFALVWVATAGLWLHMSRLWQKPFGLWVFAAFVVCMQLRFEQRPEVFSYFFLMLMMFFAWRGKILPLFVVQVLWTNCHGYFVMGPFVAAALLFHHTGNWRRSALAGVALLAATLITPFGYHTWESVWNYVQLGRGLRELNHELFMPTIWPFYWPTTVFWLAWVVTLALVVRSLAYRIDVIPGLLGLAGLFLGGQAIRNMPLLFLLAPLLWRSFDFNFKSAPIRFVNAATAGLLGAALSASVVLGYYHGWVGALSTFGVHLEGASYPIRVVDFLKNRGFQGKIFADSYDGGYLEFNLANIQIAGDSYFADAEQTKRFFAAIKEPPALLQLLNQFNFDALVINIENEAIMDMLLGNREWVPAFADSHRTVFVRQITNPQFDGDLSQFKFYYGDDLRNWTYEFGVVSWMALAFRLQRPAMMKKILTDLALAPAIPSTVFKIALKYSVDHKDEEMIRTLAPLRDRVF